MAERPLAKIRIRWSQLSFAFWDNDRKIPSITLTKSWRDDSGQWHNQNINVARRDLVELVHQLPKVLDLYDSTASNMRGAAPAQGQRTAPANVEVEEGNVGESYEFIE